MKKVGSSLQRCPFEPTAPYRGRLDRPGEVAKTFAKFRLPGIRGRVSDRQRQILDAAANDLSCAAVLNLHNDVMKLPAGDTLAVIRVMTDTKYRVLRDDDTSAPKQRRIAWRDHNGVLYIERAADSTGTRVPMATPGSHPIWLKVDGDSPVNMRFAKVKRFIDLAIEGHISDNGSVELLCRWRLVGEIADIVCDLYLDGYERLLDEYSTDEDNVKPATHRRPAIIARH